MTKDRASAKLSIVLPAKDEAQSLKLLLPELKRALPEAEIIVVNDASRDNTEQVCAENNVRCVSNSYGLGNGGAIKAGARTAANERLLFMDADGQHSVIDVVRMLGSEYQGFDMVVGARTGSSQAGWGRRVANAIYNVLASWMVGHRIPDLTSGFRVVDARKFREFIHLLPNGFSYPTKIKMEFLRAGYTVGNMPIEARTRLGKSHIKAAKDTVRFFVIIFRVGTLYSPLKLFVPISFLFFILGMGNYAYTYVTESRFTNMSALLVSASVLIFLIGLISEQITNLLYSRRQD